MNMVMLVTRIDSFIGGTSDLYLTMKAPGTLGGPASQANLVLQSIPSVNLAGVVVGNTYTMSFA